MLPSQRHRPIHGLLHSLPSLALGPDGRPDYALTHPAVLRDLAEHAEDCMRLTEAKPVLFVLDEHANAWLKAAGATIRSGVQAGFACGCDFAAPAPIWGQRDVQSKCPAVCGAHGGWNGEWVTTVPGQSSSCGCNACDIPSRRDDFPIRAKM